MRTVLIGAVACLTAATFFGAERLTSSNASVVALEQQATTEAAVKAQLKQSTASYVNEIASLKEASASSVAQIASLQGTVETLTAKRDELALQLITAEDEAASHRERTADVEAMYNDVVEMFDLQEAELLEKDQQLNAVRTQADDLTVEDAQLVEEIAALSDELNTRDEMIVALKEEIEAAKAEHTADASTTEAGSAPVAQTTEELASANTQIDELTVALSEANDALSAREAELAALETELKETQVAAETVQVAVAPQGEQSAQIETLDAQIAELTQTLEEQSGVIANLRLGFGEEKMEPMEMAEVCIARASGILEASQINFGTGTSSISESSVVTLESLRDLAIGCENDDVILEIGGHTDSLGAQSANQALSEARAQTVKEFFVQRGIPDENMIAVGFGEANPIATNETNAGRAANRRITFTWQMREEASNTTTTVDG